VHTKTQTTAQRASVSRQRVEIGLQTFIDASQITLDSGHAQLRIWFEYQLRTDSVKKQPDPFKGRGVRYDTILSKFTASIRETPLF
jgi:hypothetical protein